MADQPNFFQRLLGGKSRPSGPSPSRSASSTDLPITNSHNPPPFAKAHLGKIVDLLPYGKLLMSGRQKEIFFASVPMQKQNATPAFIYMETSALDLDTDGQKGSWGKTQPERWSDGREGTPHKDETAYSENIDANVTRYVVLPLTGEKSSHYVGEDVVSKGDIAVVIGQGKIVYAMFADTGPHEKLGEGSIALHRAFDHEVMGGEYVANSAINSTFVTIIFPGSRHGIPTNDEMAKIGASLLTKLGGHP